MEALSRMLSAVVNHGLMASFSVGDPQRGPISVSHLLFVDDTLIFCDAEQDHLRALKALLRCFEATSGLRVNFDKSKLVPVGTFSTTQQLVSTLGCKVTSLLMTYLGLSLGAASQALSIWGTIIGKIVKIDSVEEIVFVERRPASMAVRIEKLYRDFLWSGMRDEFKFHLVSWDQVYRPILSGGLEIKNLRTFNQALLGK
ncbi:hypothetical protein F2P56_023351 [Juglans regia]|uniref:Uncharacterized protein LOC109010732 n=2 Tax=Juglans regia TaxID=51240 RepID=A0A2I4GTH0_JUGRE|nr:uncharacterized protein LOC109010732 [Juglans regia]KAF5459400.1 hypothetical protein F2P56_023351 [Juglans regia]